MSRFLSHCVEVYRLKRLDGVDKQPDGSWILRYTLGPLRARVRYLRIRVPVLWACDLILSSQNV